MSDQYGPYSSGNLAQMYSNRHPIACQECGERGSEFMVEGSFRRCLPCFYKSQSLYTQAQVDALVQAAKEQCAAVVRDAFVAYDDATCARYHDDEECITAEKELRKLPALIMEGK